MPYCRLVDEGCRRIKRHTSFRLNVRISFERSNKRKMRGATWMPNVKVRVDDPTLYKFKAYCYQNRTTMQSYLLQKIKEAIE